MKERLRTLPGGSPTPERARFFIEEVGGHGVLVRRRSNGDKIGVSAKELVSVGLRQLLDFALPARCAGCGTIVDEVHSFCSGCWAKVEFLGDSGCSTCGLPLEATDAEVCGACIARSPRIQRTRSAVAYDDLSRSIAIRLKYGRKVALARTMARYMAPLISADARDAILVPVPLHRGRLWQRGFNQSALVAAELARRSGLKSDHQLLKRVKANPRAQGYEPDPETPDRRRGFQHPSKGGA